jgi:hypothetical protein
MSCNARAFCPVMRQALAIRSGREMAAVIRSGLTVECSGLFVFVGEPSWFGAFPQANRKPLIRVCS